MKKKKSFIKILGIVLTAISGTVLTVVTGGVMLPATVVSIASVVGGVGTSLIVLDHNLKTEEEK